MFKTVVPETPEQDGVDEVNQMTLEAGARAALRRGRGRAANCGSTRTRCPLGRIAAQMAKQVIFQKVREAERDTVFQ